MTYWVRAILFVILIGLWSDFLWKSSFSYKWNVWLKSLSVVCALCTIGWVGWLNVSKAYKDEEFPPNIPYMTYYGSLDPNLRYVEHSNPPLVQGVRANKVVINGDQITRFSKRYNLVSTCFHWDGTRDWKDVQNIVKSAAFDINGGTIEMAIPWNAQYLSELLAGDKQTTYVILLVPKKTSPDSFTSIREAIDQGAKILQSAGGPP